jgi:phage terminase large subunit-like protein
LPLEDKRALEKKLKPFDPLEDYRDKDPIRWIETHFYIPETGRPLELRPYQKAALREALRRDKNGIFDHSIVLWGDVKKSIKSTIAAAVGLWRAFQVDWGQVIIVANDLKQAESRVFFYMRRAIDLHPHLSEKVRMVYKEIRLPNRTVIEAVPIDPTGEAGGNADMVIYSELWGAHETAKQRMWTETTLPPNKFGRAQRWVESYAGYSGESVLFESLYLQATDKGEKITLEGAPDLPAYVNRSARMFAIWNQRGRMPWHTKEYYAQEEAVLLPNEFRRIHQNEWVTSEDVFVPAEAWARCKDTAMPDASLMEPWIVALDAGVSGDSFAIVAVARDPRNMDTDTLVRYARKWTPPKGRKIDFQGTPENPGPELEVRRLLEERNVVQVAYDPYQLEDMAGRLRKEGLGWLRAFSQAKERLIADSQLRSMILEARVHHAGDPVLREHVINANAKMDPEERKIRIVKRSDLLKIDLCVALSMANAECMRLNL